METQVSQLAEHKTLVIRAFLPHKRFDASWTWRMDFTRRDRGYSNVHFVVRTYTTTATRESVWTFFWPLYITNYDYQINHEIARIVDLKIQKFLFFGDFLVYEIFVEF